MSAAAEELAGPKFREKKNRPPPIIACASKAEVESAVAVFVRPGDSAVVLGAELGVGGRMRSVAHALARAAGADARVDAALAFWDSRLRGAGVRVGGDGDGGARWTHFVGYANGKSAARVAVAAARAEPRGVHRWRRDAATGGGDEAVSAEREGAVRGAPPPARARGRPPRPCACVSRG